MSAATHLPFYTDLGKLAKKMNDTHLSIARCEAQLGEVGWRVHVYKKCETNTYISRINSGLFAVPFGGVINDTMQVAPQETKDVIETLID